MEEFKPNEVEKVIIRKIMHAEVKRREATSINAIDSIWRNMYELIAILNLAYKGKRTFFWNVDNDGNILFVSLNKEDGIMVTLATINKATNSIVYNWE